MWLPRAQHLPRCSRDVLTQQRGAQDMRREHERSVVEVGERARDSPDTSGPAPGKTAAFGFGTPCFERVGRERQQPLEGSGRYVRVASPRRAAKASALSLDRTGDSLAHHRGRLTREVTRFGRAHRQPYIEAIEQGSGEPTVAGEGVVWSNWEI